MADLTLVNSKFTESVFRVTFPSLSSRPLKVLYPSLNTRFFDDHRAESNKSLGGFLGRPDLNEEAYQYIFLSINRFERKKNIELAIRAFGE